MDNKEFAKAIDTYVRPSTFPVAAKLLKKDEPVPERARRPVRDLGIQIAICQAIAMARRYGWTLAVGPEDVNCPLTKTAFGFAPVTEFYTSGQLACGMYTETAEAGARTEAATRKLGHAQFAHLLVGPVANMNLAPDAIVIYGNSAQVLRLVTGALWKRGGALTSTMTGRVDCSDEVITTMLTGDYQVILPCYGDRVLGQTQDHEMAFSLPGSKMQELVSGLEGTQRGGVVYPIPTFLRYSPQYPEKYNELEKIWAAMPRT